MDSKEKAQACQIRIANPDYDNIIRQQQEKSMQFSQSVEKHHIKINKKLLAYIGAGIAGCVLLSIIIIAATSLLKKPVNVMSTSTEVSSNNNVQDRQDETDTNTNTNTDTYVPEQLQTQNSKIGIYQLAEKRSGFSLTNVLTPLQNNLSHTFQVESIIKGSRPLRKVVRS